MQFSRLIKTLCRSCVTGTLVCGAFFSLYSFAGDVKIVNASASCVERVCRFDVTLEHDDTGFEHYADQWQVLDPDGNVLATRTLFHPHVDEQPFTRSLSGVIIPDSLTRVLIAARDSVHGVAPTTYSLDLDLK
ncbi:MAG: hypothetical protein DHS20C01_25560 [marine bacterium B5-7]|nr:MAG: hypothetical protein DHS20C01_25560 [marine bacterium B5-7]